MDSKNDKRLYRTDITEATLRRRAFDIAVQFEHVDRFDDYNSGYMQALKDLDVEKEYRDIYKRVTQRVRKSYVSDKAYYNEVVRSENEY